ncbi:MAG: histidine kinase [Lachnospiraceae bacterium]|nr:histidine kinase [Lachnospiraceae bacterium]
MFFSKHGFIFNRKSKDSLSSGLKRVILGMILVVIVSFIISTYVVTETERRDFSVRESESVIKTLSNNIISDIDKYKSLSRLIMTDDKTLIFLRSDVHDIDIGMVNDARYSIMEILNVTEGVDSVIIFREDMKMVATNRFSYNYDYDLMNTDTWKTDIYTGLGKAVVSLNSNKIATKQDGSPVVTIGRAIFDIDSQERTGILLMNISPKIFNNLLLELRYDDICIMGSDGTFLSGNEDYAKYYKKEFSEKGLTHKNIKIAGKNMLLSSGRIEGLPLVILRVSAYQTKGIPTKMVVILLFLLLIFIALAIYIAMFIRKNISEPIMEMSSSMDENRQSGELHKISVPVPNDELRILENDYNSMIDHVNELIDKLMEKEKNLQKAEMRVLQEQIKPHFLYNSIDTIGYMALDAGARDVHGALETLGSFYRNFLSKGEKEIPLSREVWIVKDYLSIQKLRYGDILDDVYDIAEDTKDLIVPKLILQPLVENCIYHGIRPKGERGTIKISSRLSDGNLHIIVRDTGVGMSTDAIEKVLSAKKNEAEDLDSESFGLWGTIERVRYYSGKEDIVRIRSEIGEYTEIEFII